MQLFPNSFRFLPFFLLALAAFVPTPYANAQSSPSASVLGIGEDSAGRSLLVRVPSTGIEGLQLLAHDRPLTLTSSQAAVLVGIQPTHELVIELAAFCEAPTACAQPLQGLQRAIEATFNPGERLIVRAPTDSPSLIAQTDLDEIRSSVQALLSSVSQSGIAVGQPASALAELRTTTVVGRLSLVQSMVQSFVAQPALYPAHINVLVVGSPSADAQALCQQVSATGGLCRAAVDPARAPEMLQALLEDVQRVDQLAFACLSPNADVERSAAVPVQAANGGAPVMVAGEQVWCAPPPEPTRILPVWVWIVTGGGGFLLLTGLLLMLRRRPSVESVSPLDGLPDNSHAWVRHHTETVDDRPEWLPDPVLLAAREQLRSAVLPVPPQGLLVWMSAQQAGQTPMPATGSVEIGGVAGVPLSGSHTVPVARLVRSAVGQSPTLELATPDVVARVRVNGRPAHQGLVLRAGDEVSVDSTLLLEFRMPIAEAASRLAFSDSRAFGSLSALATTTVLGRDPLRYQGVTPVASKLRIDGLSSDHLALWISGGVLYARDLGSANGTFLDGVRLQAYVVYPVTKGQRLELGAVVEGIAE